MEPVNQSFFSSLITSLIKFIKRPEYDYQEMPFLSKIKLLGGIYVINLIVTGFLLAALSFTDSLLPEDTMKNHEVAKMFNNSPLWVSFIMAAVFAPIGEELIFRFPLKYREWVIHVLAGGLMVLGGGKTFFLESITIKIACLAFIIVLAVLYSIFNKKIIAFTALLWSNKFPVVFYVFTFVFAVVHLENYPFSLAVVLLFPLLVLPQFVIGTFLGYIRIKLGIAWSMAFHGIHNGFFVLMFVLASAGTFGPLTIKNADYELSIAKSEKNSVADITYKEKNNGLEIKRYDFKGCLAILLDKEERFIEVNDDFKSGVYLDIHYKMHKGDTTKMKGIILKEMEKAYKFSLDTIQREEPHYELYVIDAAKLQKHKSKSKDLSSSFTYNNDNVKMENSSVKDIIVSLNTNYKEGWFFTDMDVNEKYTLKYEINSFDEAEKYFKEQFGLGFRKSEKEVEIINVEFEE